MNNRTTIFSHQDGQPFPRRSAVDPFVGVSVHADRFRDPYVTLTVTIGAHQTHHFLPLDGAESPADVYPAIHLLNEMRRDIDAALSELTDLL